jgi:N-acetyl-anhydromuramyl-L-alanine amidase AmpD
LKEGGFYHLAMAAIIGVAAWTRGREKIERIAIGAELIERNTTTQTPVDK